jgi:hypothetical protein
METFDIERFALGSLCKRKHDYNGTGMSLRRRRGGMICVKCQAINQSDYYWRNAEKKRQYQAEYVEKNRDLVRESERRRDQKRKLGRRALKEILRSSSNFDIEI